MKFTKLIKKYAEFFQSHIGVIKNIFVYIICFGIFPSIISRPNYLYGIVFTIIISFYMYWIHMIHHLIENNNKSEPILNKTVPIHKIFEPIHKISEKIQKTFAPINKMYEPLHKLIAAIHIYHHDHSDYVSYYGQIFTEIVFINIAVLLNMYFNNTITQLFLWIAMYDIMLYSLVHTINYGLLKVNNYHQLHHIDPTTNFGPDIWDYICSSKNIETPNIEDISHYIVPAVLSLVFVLVIQHLMKEPIFTYLFNAANILSFIIYLALSLYIYYFL